MSEEASVWENIRNGRTWLRGVFMLLFVLIYGVVEVILTAVVVLQFLFVLFTGGRNPRLLQFGEGLAGYVMAILRYWTYNSEEKPFPFAPWPGAEDTGTGK